MHERFTMLMSLVLDGAATRFEEQLLREHLTTCRVCAATWEQWQAMEDLLGTAPMLMPPRDLMEGVMVRLEQHHRYRQRSCWLGWGLLALWVAMLTCSWLVLTGVIWWGLQHPMEVGVIFSAAAQLLSGMSWFLRGVQTLAGSIGSTAFVVSLACCVSLAGGLALFWLWVMSRSRGWVRLTALGAT